MTNWFTGLSTGMTTGTSDRCRNAVASSGRARLPERRNGRYLLPAEGDVH